MSSITIPKSKMREICTEIMKSNTLIAQMSNGKKVDFLEVENTCDILMEDEIAYKSPKEFYFPRSEKIIQFTKTEAKMVDLEEKVAIFGVRPCDLEAIQVMDNVFTGGRFVDPFFKAHKENTLLIGVGCNEAKSGCFCDRRELDMKYSEKCDLFLANNGENYDVMFVSEKGKKELSTLISGLDKFENTKVESPKFEKTQLSIEAETEQLFDKVDWAKLTDICQGCGMCTFICPTCHCFEFKDVEEKGGNVGRFRRWDSCMFPKFTIHASGHNPRVAKADRYRQRVLHKYVYIKKNFGCVACTGCGRCVRSCPAGMDISKIVEGIMEVFA